MQEQPEANDSEVTGTIRLEVNRSRPKPMTVGRFFRRTFGVIFTIVLAAALILVGVVFLLLRGPSESARDLTVTTLLESGALKFVPSLFLSTDEITDIVSKQTLGEIDTDALDAKLIDTNTSAEDKPEFDINAIELIEVSGRTYYAKLMIINDPSRVRLETTYPWVVDGLSLEGLVNQAGCIGGVNGGLYNNLNGHGQNPGGVVVKGGEVQWMELDISGLYLIGLDTSNLLQIINIQGMSEEEVRKTIADRQIRDAICFQDEASDTNNHFVPLIINGEPRELNGAGSGANPRTVIGQRADGAIMFLVTDGRGAQGHLGATASDLIDVMLEHGAVNAANLDGGSSSSLYYNGKYEMTSVTLYIGNESARMPTAFVIEGR